MNPQLIVTGRRRLLVAGAVLLLLPVTAWAKATPPDDLQSEIAIMQRESKARAEIVAQASPAVVNITVVKHASGSDAQAQQLPDPFNDDFFRKFFQNRVPTPPKNFQLHGLGTGIIVNAKGYVLTNNHVIDGADKITVKLPDGRTFDGKVIGADPGSDVAVVRIDGSNLPVAKLGDSEAIQVGESVLAIGNPFGLEQTTTLGIVSAKGRNQLGVADYENFIQTDASINPGNSGGPLLNLKGEVIGMNTAIYGGNGGNVGVGFAIPINQARDIMESLIATGKVVRGFLGVGIQDITADLAGALNAKPGQGVLVSSVGPHTPAADAGIQQGDVITSFRNRPVTSGNDLRNVVAATKPGTTVSAEVLRNGKTLNVNVKVAEQPKDMVAATDDGSANSPGGAATPASGHVLGMTLRPLGSDDAAQMGMKGQHGVLIAAVDDNGPAAEAGLQQGMAILSVNHQPVSNPREVREQVEHTPKKGFVLLLVRMGDSDRFVALHG